MDRMNNVIDYLQRSAKKNPNKIAFADETKSITYAELVKTARGYGSYLSTIVPPQQPIAILSEKSVDTIICFFSVIYAGCFYVPLNIKHPKERIQSILETLENPYVVVLEGFDKCLPDYDKDKIIRLNKDYLEDENKLQTIRNNHIDVDPLYVLFTSGSTGKPKGIAVSHRSVIDFIDVFTDLFNIKEEDVIGNQAPFDFDVSVKDIYSTIKMGATMQIIPKAKFSFPTYLIDYLIERKVTTLIWAVSALCILSTFNAFEYKVPKEINKIIFSGEVMPIKQLNAWKKYYPQASFINVYGPTEITCNCTYYIINKGQFEKDVLPIGKPFPNERILLIDENGQRAEGINKIGEICVTGTALSLGYYNKKEETSIAFAQNPLQSRYLEPIYRTGDLGYYNEDGDLCFSGRKDFQVKHMGHRIELNEIESAIAAIEDVKKVVVLYDHAEEKICAFYIGNIETPGIVKVLRSKIPSYMIPGKFIKVDHFDLTENGKTDRKKLAKEYNIS